MQFSISEYVDPKHDVPGPLPQLARRLFVCTTPRTGGHFLCSHLREAGFGLPTEYFGPQIALPLISRWLSAEHPNMRSAAHVMPEYAGHLLRLRSRSGMFAAKIFANDWPAVRAGLGEDLQHAVFLIVARRDVYAQVISLLALLKTGNAFNADIPLTHFELRSEINGAVVKQTLDWIVRQNAMWSHLLAPFSRVYWTDMESVIASSGMLTDQLGEIFGMSSSISPRKPQENWQPYAQDRELKEQLKAQFGDLIRGLVDDLPPDFMVPPNAKRVC
jgi:hypothetical protein